MSLEQYYDYLIEYLGVNEETIRRKSWKEIGKNFIQ